MLLCTLSYKNYLSYIATSIHTRVTRNFIDLYPIYINTFFWISFVYFDNIHQQSPITLGDGFVLKTLPTLPQRASGKIRDDEIHRELTHVHNVYENWKKKNERTYKVLKMVFVQTKILVLCKILKFTPLPIYFPFYTLSPSHVFYIGGDLTEVRGHSLSSAARGALGQT